MSELSSNIKVICLEDQAFHVWMKETVQLIKKENSVALDPWITKEEAMQFLRINAPATFQRYKDSGKIKFSKVDGSSKKILYYRKSILDFIESGVVEPDSSKQSS